MGLEDGTMLNKPLVAEGSTAPCSVLGKKNVKVLAFILGLVVTW